MSNPAAFSEYQDLAHPTIDKYGGKVVFGSDKIEVGDGTWSPIGMIVIEFESLQQAKAWYNSPEYNPLISKRTGSTDSSVIFVDGS